MEFVEAKRTCADCPINTSDTEKSDCIHPWRHLLEFFVASDGLTKIEVPRDLADRCKKLGAVVSTDSLDGERPSVQVYSEKPPARDGYNVVQSKQ